MINFRTFAGCLVFIFLFSCQTRNNLRIYQIPRTDRLDTIKDSNKIVYNKIRYFIVAGNISNKTEFLNIVDSFSARQYYNDSIKNVSQYTMIFYKESAETNLKNIQKDPKKLDDAFAQQHDLILTYNWYIGRKPYRNEFKDGKIINLNGKIKIEDNE